MSVKSLASVDARIRELKAELRQTAIYQELTVLEEMRPKLAAINGELITVTAIERRLPLRKGKQPKGDVTQHEAAAKAVEAAGHPLTIEEIVDALPRFGAVITGKNAKTNLTSILSKRGRLFSLRWKGKRVWWIKGREVPAA